MRWDHVTYRLALWVVKPIGLAVRRYRDLQERRRLEIEREIEQRRIQQDTLARYYGEWD